MDLWDPLGVSIYPEAVDEYLDYAEHIQTMVLDKNPSAQGIAAYLKHVEVDIIGLPGRDLQRADICAAAIVSLMA